MPTFVKKNMTFALLQIDFSELAMNKSSVFLIEQAVKEETSKTTQEVKSPKQKQES